LGRRLPVAIALLGLVGLMGARHVGASRRAARSAASLSAAAAQGGVVLRVPHAPGAITLDGDTDDPGWLKPPGPARTGDFSTADGKPARPHSSARLVWGGDYLYLALYAADEDIECHEGEPDALLATDDAFRVVFSQPGVDYAIQVTPKALIRDSIRRGDGAWDPAWSSGAHASWEIDGTMNYPKDRDEEWAIELAVPFESIGMKGERGENVGLSLQRCDTPKEGPRVCASWGGRSDGAASGRIVLD
jgi:hypothetical protein